MCETCVIRNLVFPAWEAFEDRLENPTTYCLFYDLFLRAVEGEEKWKLVTNNKSDTPPKIATPLNESFALIVLKNNYFAWLMDYKQGHPELLTDYDMNVDDDGSNTVAEYVISGICIANGEHDFHIIPNSRKGMGDYEMAQLAFNKKTKEVRAKAKTSAEYAQMIVALHQMGQSDESTTDEKQRKSKKRRLQKELRQYTGTRVGEEKAYKGWSARAHKDQSDFKKSIEEQNRKYGGFDKEYRRLVQVTRKLGSGLVESSHDIDNVRQEMRRISDEMFQLPEGIV